MHVDHVIGLEDTIVNAKLSCQCQYSDGVHLFCCGHATVLSSRFKIGIFQLPRNFWETEQAQAQTYRLSFAHPSNKATWLQISIFDCTAISLVCSPNVIMHTLDNPYIHAWMCKVTIGGRTGTAGQAWIIFSADMPNLAQSAFVWYILVVVVSTKEGTFWLKVYCIQTT